MNCNSCGKAISGAYEVGSYTCSGCGAGVEVNPSTPGDKTPMPRIAVVSDSLGWEQQQREMQGQLCVHCGVPATTTAYGKFLQTQESPRHFWQLEAEGLHWCCAEHQGLHAGGKNPSSNPLTAKKRKDVERALDNHEKLKGSYFWKNLGNASSRRNDEKKYNFGVKVGYKGDEYTYDSNVRVSTRNFYYTGTFRKNGKKGDVRIFKKLLTVK